MRWNFNLLFIFVYLNTFCCFFFYLNYPWSNSSWVSVGSFQRFVELFWLPLIFTCLIRYLLPIFSERRHLAVEDGLHVDGRELPAEGRPVQVHRALVVRGRRQRRRFRRHPSDAHQAPPAHQELPRQPRLHLRRPHGRRWRSRERRRRRRQRDDGVAAVDVDAVEGRSGRCCSLRPRRLVDRGARDSGRVPDAVRRRQMTTKDATAVNKRRARRFRNWQQARCWKWCWKWSRASN